MRYYTFAEVHFLGLLKFRCTTGGKPPTWFPADNLVEQKISKIYYSKLKNDLLLYFENSRIDSINFLSCLKESPEIDLKTISFVKFAVAGNLTFKF